MPTIEITSQLLGLLLTGLTIVGVVGGWIGHLITRKASLDQSLTKLQHDIDTIKRQNENRAILAQATLRLSYAVGQELVKQGANGDLKKTVNELHYLVVETSLPAFPPNVSET